MRARSNGEPRGVRNSLPARRCAGLVGMAASVILAMTGFSQDAPEPPAKDGSSAPTDTVGGIVVDEQGLPVRGARVEIRFYRARHSALPEGYRYPGPVTTDSEGRWTVGRVPVAVVPDSPQNRSAGRDTYRFYVTHPDFLFSEFNSTTGSFGIDAEFRRRAARFVLMRGHVIRGMVRDEDGLGVPGAIIQRHGGILPREDPSATTDARGRYVLKAARPDDLMMRVSAPGCAVLQRRVNVNADATLDFVLKPANTITLRLRDENNRPVTRGYVNFMPDGGSESLSAVGPMIADGALPDRLLEARPDSEGVVVWDQAPAGTVVAGIHMDRFESQRVRVTAGAEVAVVLRPQPTPIVTVRVTDAGTRAPLSGGSVSTGTLWPDATKPYWPSWLPKLSGEPMRRATEAGEFRGRMDESYQQYLLMFRVMRDGYAPVITDPVDSMKRNPLITVALQKREPCRIIVLNGSGSPAANAGVYVLWSGNIIELTNFVMNPHAYSNRYLELALATREDGGCVIPPFADEAAVLVAHDDGWATATYADLMKNGVVKLQPYGRIEAIVKQDGRPVSGVKYEFQGIMTLPGRRSARLITSAESDSEGRLVVPRVFPTRQVRLAEELPPLYEGGDRRLVVVSNDKTVTAGETIRLELDSKREVARPVTGRFTLRGAAMFMMPSRGGIFIRLVRPDGRTGGTTEFDRDGRFLFGGVMPGEYKLQIPGFTNGPDWYGFPGRKDREVSVPPAEPGEAQKLVNLGHFELVDLQAKTALEVLRSAATTPVPPSGVAPVGSPTMTDIVGGFVVDEQGVPIQGAKVEVLFNRTRNRSATSVLPEGYRSPVSATTDAEGAWSIRRVPPGVVPDTWQNTQSGKETYRLYVTHPEHLFQEFGGTNPIRDQDAEFRRQTAKLVLKRGHVVRGVVRDEDGLGIAGATVQRNYSVLAREDPGATTDELGRYVIKAARAGSLFMRVRAPGHALVHQRASVDGDATLDFTLKRASTITLKLRDEKDMPVTQGVVSFLPDDQARERSERLWTARPDAAGIVTWDEAPDTEVYALIYGGSYEVRKEKVAAGAVQSFTLRLKPPLPVITLKVTETGTGKPLAGCVIDTGSVYGTSTEPRPLWSLGQTMPVAAGATEGDYLVKTSEFSRSYRLMFRVRCEGYMPVMTAPVSPGGDLTIAVSLQPRQPTPITVVREDGSPAAKVGVYVAWSGRAVNPASSVAGGLVSRMVDFVTNRRHPEFAGATDDEGRCLLPACADEASVLVAHETGYATAGYADLIKDGTMRLQPLRPSEDKILKLMIPPTADEQPPTRLRIRLMRGDDPVLNDRALILSGAAGDGPGATGITAPAFVRQGVADWAYAPGTRNLQVGIRTQDGAYCFSSLLTAEPKPGEPLEVAAPLEPGIRLAGRVADQVPRPMKDARVYVYVSADDRGDPARLFWSDWAALREDGSFDFPSLPPGHVRFFVLADGWMSPITPEEDGGKNRPWSAGLVSQSRSDLLIPMQRTATCDVTVLDASGIPVSGAVVQMSAAFSPDGFTGEWLMFDGARGDLRIARPTLDEAFSTRVSSARSVAPERFLILTDARGHATIRGLPPSVELGPINVNPPGVDLRKVVKPAGSTPVGNLKPGETTELKVQLAP